MSRARCLGPRAEYAHLPNKASPDTTSMAYKNACNDGQNNIKPPCVALIVDDPTYDAGQNEGIVARLARPTRVSSEDGQVVGIQIVYGNVLEVVDEAEQNDRPLLVYSWVPRAEVMRPGRFVRITLESFYHCDPDESTPAIPMSSSLASTIEREVVACDFPIEHVEKAVVWRLQQPSSTKAALFVNKFNLNADQLLELLEIGAEWKENSSSSEAELDHIACLWLNKTTTAWKEWLKPDVALYNTELYDWKAWLMRCGLFLFVVLCAAGLVKWVKKADNPKVYEPKTATEPKTQTAKWRLKRPVAEGQAAKDQALKEQEAAKSWPEELGTCSDAILRISRCAPFGNVFCCTHSMKESGWWHVFIYLSEARQCLSEQRYTAEVLLFALGRIFVAASNGFFEVALFDLWLSDGLDRLSLEVTISCAVLMLSLRLIEWGLGSLPTCDTVVQEQLENRLLIKCRSMSESDLKSESAEPFPGDEDKEFLTLEDQFQQAYIFTASQLASNCYVAALKVFFSFCRVLFAVGFLFFHTFKMDNPGNLSTLMIFAFACAPAWLLILLVIGPLVKSLVSLFTKSRGKRATASYTTAYEGILWVFVYSLWAIGPILLNPLPNKLGPGTNSASRSDLLTASTVSVTHSSIDHVVHLLLCSTTHMHMPHAHVYVCYVRLYCRC